MSTVQRVDKKHRGPRVRAGVKKMIETTTVGHAPRGQGAHHALDGRSVAHVHPPELAAGSEAPPERKQVRRQDLKPGECLCSYCTAKCCRYFALPIDQPDTWHDFDTIRWFLLHEGAAVFTEDDAWYLLVSNKCRHLGDDNLCGIYADRPAICRKYTTRNCEYDDTWVYERYLETPEQVEEYAEALLGPKRGRGIRSPKPK